MERPGGEFIDQFLTKPVSPSHLFDAIMVAFGVQTGQRRKASKGREFDLSTLRPVQGARILLVEDNEINQQVASEILEQAGFVVDIANHGQEALDQLEQKGYDCVLMDVQMPVMDGYTATRKIREQDKLGDLPILAMTANATVEDQERSLAAGMNEHIAKPINPQILFSALLKWITHEERALPESYIPAGGRGDQPDLPDLPGVDVEDGVSRFGGNVQSYMRLLHKFAENQANAIDEIMAAVESGDREAAERSAHTLKGVSGNIGATQLRALATEVEAAIKSGKDDQLGSLTETTGVELNRIGSMIRTMDPESETGPTPGGPPKDLLQRLEALLEKLEDYDSAAEEDILDILDLVRGTAVHETLTGVRNKITQYDLEGAAEDLKPIMEEMESSGDTDG
jgi:CheY-like chemotaxis protein